MAPAIDEKRMTIHWRRTANAIAELIMVDLSPFEVWVVATCMPFTSKASSRSECNTARQASQAGAPNASGRPRRSPCRHCCPAPCASWILAHESDIMRRHGAIDPVVCSARSKAGVLVKQSSGRILSPSQRAPCLDAACSLHQASLA